MMQAHDQGTTAENSVPWTAAADYTLDAWQRGILFLDVLRQRGNQYFEHMAMRAPNVLHFDAHLVVDGRSLPRPVNYALVGIAPPPGVEIDPRKRPFVVVDPRAGHGPGIGGFKADSEIGVAMAAGHPCYFVGFLPEPVPGQTIEDIMVARGRVPRAGDRAAPRGRRQAGGGRQLPGRLGDDAGGRDPAGAVRPADHRRRALVLLGRRARPEPDALFGRPLWRQLADGAGGRSRRRHLRRRRPGPELREHEPREHALVQAVQSVRQDRHRGPALSRLREVVGRPCAAQCRGDAVDRRQSVRRQQARHGRDRHARRRAHRPAQHHGADHLLLLEGRRHHAAAAGAGLDPGPVRQRRRHPRQRPDHRLLRPRIGGPSGHLRLRQRGEEGASGVRDQHRLHRLPAARAVRDRADAGGGRYRVPRAGGRRLRGQLRGAHARRHPGVGRQQPGGRARVRRGGAGCPRSISASTAPCCSRGCGPRPRPGSPTCCAGSIRLGCSSSCSRTATR